MNNKLSEPEIKSIKDFLDRVEKMETSAFLRYLKKRKKYLQILTGILKEVLSSKQTLQIQTK